VGAHPDVISKQRGIGDEVNVQFESVQAFFAMGGHALYVWMAYGATFAVLIGSFLILRSARKRQFQRLRWQSDSEMDTEMESVMGSESAGELDSQMAKTIDKAEQSSGEGQ
jgi:heme exporter protein D